MRARLVLVALAFAIAVVPTALSATGIKATLKAPAFEPTIDVDWYYSIKVTDLRGRPLKARLTAKVIDPFGGVHPMDYGPSEPPKPITNRPFKGTFRDYLTFPPESRGFKLTLRWTIKAKIGTKTYTKVLTRKVTPQS
jgi:hypothetical protein